MDLITEPQRRCEPCDETFASQYSLKRHNERKHPLSLTLRRMFNCPKCRYQSHRDQDLKDHIRKQHSPQHKFRCECGYATNHKPDYTRHQDPTRPQPCQEHLKPTTIQLRTTTHDPYTCRHTGQLSTISWFLVGTNMCLELISRHCRHPWMKPAIYSELLSSSRRMLETGNIDFVVACAFLMDICGDTYTHTDTSERLYLSKYRNQNAEIQASVDELLTYYMGVVKEADQALSNVHALVAPNSPLPAQLRSLQYHSRNLRERLQRLGSELGYRRRRFSSRPQIWLLTVSEGLFYLALWQIRERSLLGRIFEQKTNPEDIDEMMGGSIEITKRICCNINDARRYLVEESRAMGWDHTESLEDDVSTISQGGEFEDDTSTNGSSGLGDATDWDEIEDPEPSSTLTKLEPSKDTVAATLAQGTAVSISCHDQDITMVIDNGDHTLWNEWDQAAPAFGYPVMMVSHSPVEPHGPYETNGGNDRFIEVD